jgi:hypothetical protein
MHQHHRVVIQDHYIKKRGNHRGQSIIRLSEQRSAQCAALADSEEGSRYIFSDSVNEEANRVSGALLWGPRWRNWHRRPSGQAQQYREILDDISKPFSSPRPSGVCDQTKIKQQRRF